MIFCSFIEKYRNKSVKARYVDFNQGLDARLLTPEKMKNCRKYQFVLYE